jgi:hypothetical protein
MDEPPVGVLGLERREEALAALSQTLVDRLTLQTAATN